MKLAEAPLEAVYIYFNTATYDEVERDVKVMKGDISLRPRILVPDYIQGGNIRRFPNSSLRAPGPQLVLDTHSN